MTTATTGDRAVRRLRWYHLRSRTLLVIGVLVITTGVGVWALQMVDPELRWLASWQNVSWKADLRRQAESEYREAEKCARANDIGLAMQHLDRSIAINGLADAYWLRAKLLANAYAFRQSKGDLVMAEAMLAKGHSLAVSARQLASLRDEINNSERADAELLARDRMTRMLERAKREAIDKLRGEAYRELDDDVRIALQARFDKLDELKALLETSAYWRHNTNGRLLRLYEGAITDPEQLERILREERERH
ncbi:MAG: hypothetical protein JSS27_19055 [Planctomycetes bacterium]|nr:hypothetical protein [Planctomycetota bacterium]